MVKSEGPIGVVPLVCHSCSAPLHSEEGDCIYYCRQCGMAWQLGREGFSEVRILHMAGNEPVRYPFWLFQFAVNTPAGTCSTLDSYLSLTGNIARPEAERRAKPPVLFVPAFTSRTPQQMLRAGRLLTLRNPAIATTNKHPDQIAPITLNDYDARLFGEQIVLSTLTDERTLNLQLLQGFSIKTGNGHLITIPFSEREGRLFQASMNLEI